MKDFGLGFGFRIRLKGVNRGGGGGGLQAAPSQGRDGEMGVMWSGLGSLVPRIAGQ